MIQKIKEWSIKKKIIVAVCMFVLIITIVGSMFNDNSVEPVKVGEVYVTNTEYFELSNGDYQHNHTLMVLGYDDDFESSNNPTFHIGYESNSIYPELLNLSMCEVWVYEDGTIELRSMQESTSYGYTTYTEVGRIHFDNLFWRGNWDSTLVGLN